MSELISQLGVDWRSLASQAVNFLLLLIALRLFVYKPVLKILRDRKTKIEEGLIKAEEADRRLGGVALKEKERMKKAEEEALALMRKTEEKAKKLEALMLKEAEEKERVALEKTQLILKAKQEEMEKAMEKEAAHMVKSALFKTVEMRPNDIDDALIEKAIKQVQKR